MTDGLTEAFKRMGVQDRDVSLEMIHSFIETMNDKQLERLCDYAAKIFGDKRYGKKN